MTSPDGVTDVVGVLLAGGRSSRMGGGHKCLLTIGDRTVIDRVIARARPQVTQLVLNVSNNVECFQHCGLPMIADTIDGFAGPLAGVLAALEWTRGEQPTCRWVASFATDTPFLPADLVVRLLARVHDDDSEMACAASRGRVHPTFGLWPVHLAPALRQALVIEGARKIDSWTQRYRLATTDFPADRFDPFFNLNTPEDLREAERLLAAGAST